MTRQLLTVSEAAERAGIPHAVAHAGAAWLLEQGDPGVTRHPGGTYAVHEHAVPHLADAAADAARADSRTPAAAATGVPATTNRPPVGSDTYEREPIPTTQDLVSTARDVERVLATVTTRSARALAESTWRHATTASRHVPTRDGMCAHDGWQYPCPDLRDAAAAIADVAAVVLDGAS